MSQSREAFQETLGPDGDHVHVIAEVVPELHAAQSWADRVVPGARVRHSLPYFHAVALRCAPAALEALGAHPDVVSLEPDLRVRGCLDQGTCAMAIPSLWEAGLTGKGVRLAILDTGVDRGHPDFQGRLAGIEDFTGLGVRDDHGHGTFVTSVAAGSGEASRGRYRGLAPAADLLVCRVLNVSGEGRVSDVMAGLWWARTRDARVVSLSLATGSGRAEGALARALMNGSASGMLVCQTMEVKGREESERSTLLQCSSKPEAPVGVLLMPGVRVGARAYGTQQGRPVMEGYCEASGLSAAAACLAGLCALLLEAHPEIPTAGVAAALRRTQAALPPGRPLQAPAVLAQLRAGSAAR